MPFLETLTIRRLATRWLDRQSGVLEAPPAMVAQIGEWVQATTAATAAARVEEAILRGERYRSEQEPRYVPLRTSLARLRALLPTGATKPLWDLYKEVVGHIQDTVRPVYRGLGIKEFQGLTSEKRDLVLKSLVWVEDSIEAHLNWGEHQAEQERRELAKLRPFLRSGVPPMPAGQITRQFPVDITGWRYEALAAQMPILQARNIKFFIEKANKALAKPNLDSDILEDMLDVQKVFQKRLTDLIEYGKHPWSSVQVRLTYNLGVERASAYWQEATRTVAIEVPLAVSVWDLEGKLLQSLRHELQHFAQSYLTAALDRTSVPTMRKPGPGMPSRHVMTPQFRQESPSPGMNPGRVHALDDVEFHTRLADAITEAKAMLVHHNDRKQDYYKRNLTAEERRAYLGAFIGVMPKGGDMAEEVRYQPGNTFFLAIKKFAPGKWKKAVSELVKAVA